MNATTLVVVAYGFIWAVVVGYVVILARRQARLARDLEELRKKHRLSS